MTFRPDSMVQWRVCDLDMCELFDLDLDVVHIISRLLPGDNLRKMDGTRVSAVDSNI